MATTTFPCFGSTVSITAAGADAAVALARGRATALELHRRLTRFEPGSELSRLNADPRELVPASPVLRCFAEAVRVAGSTSDGLVDATCLPLVEAAGYRSDWAPGARFAARAEPGVAVAAGDWSDVAVEDGGIRRPPGVRLDSGGLGKGLAADLVAWALSGSPSWSIDCGGDLRVGGTTPRVRRIDVVHPLAAGQVVHAFRLTEGAVATSGTTRRRWRDGHHLIDPRTGRPADTGVAQVSAVAASGLAAEVAAKAALLAGPDGAARYLPHGGVIVTDDGEVRVLTAAGAPPRSA
jgi:thiamine biosynthesis lipoprotein